MVDFILHTLVYILAIYGLIEIIRSIIYIMDFTDLNENEYNLNGSLIIFTTNLKEENYKEVIPAPLLSRFTMKALFEPVGYEIKNKYVTEKAKSLVDKYNEKYHKKIDYKNVLKLIDYKIVNNTKNFRYLNRVVQDALISIAEKEIY